MFRANCERSSYFPGPGKNYMAMPANEYLCTKDGAAARSQSVARDLPLAGVHFLPGPYRRQAMSTYRSTLILAAVAITLMACKDRPQPPVSIEISSRTAPAQVAASASVDPSLPKVPQSSLALDPKK